MAPVTVAKSDFDRLQAEATKLAQAKYAGSPVFDPSNPVFVLQQRLDILAERQQATLLPAKEKVASS